MLKEIENLSEIKVSVIMPCYNGESYLAEAIESVVAQSYKNWELIIWDDASNDSSFAVAKSYSQKFPQIKVYQGTSNQGISEVRNQAIARSQGEFIALLDCDDVWEKTKLEKQIKFMIEKNSHFSYTKNSLIDQYSQLLLKEDVFRSTCSYKNLLKKNFIACPTVMISKFLLVDLKFEGKLNEDYLLWLRITKTFDLVAQGLPEVLSRYRISTNSLSSNKRKSAINIWRLYRQHLGFSLHKSTYYFVSYVINSYKKIFQRKLKSLYEKKKES